MCDAELNDIRKMKLLKIDHDSVLSISISLSPPGMPLCRYGVLYASIRLWHRDSDGIRQVTIDEYNQTELVNKPRDSSAVVIIFLWNLFEFR